MDSTLVLTLAVTGTAAFVIGGGYLTGKFMNGPAYTCIRCDKAKVHTFPARCRPCEADVLDLMVDAANKGRVLRDPLDEYLRRNR
jgi:hypothetical protein